MIWCVAFLGVLLVKLDRADRLCLIMRFLCPILPILPSVQPWFEKLDGASIKSKMRGQPRVPFAIPFPFPHTLHLSYPVTSAAVLPISLQTSSSIAMPAERTKGAKRSGSDCEISPFHHLSSILKKSRGSIR